MKTNISITIDLDRSKMNSSGSSPIFIFLNATVNSKRIRKKIFTGYSINHEYWDSSKRQIKSMDGSDIANSEISIILSKLYKIKATLELQNEECNPELILKIYNNENYETESTNYFIFVNNEIKLNRKDYSLNYYNELLINLKVLSDFTGGKLLFEDITPTFLNRFRYHLEHEKGNKINCIYQRLTSIRKFVNEAIRQNVTKNYAFKNYQLKTEQVEKSFLEIDEIKKLHHLHDDPECSERLKVTLHYFLLSCYTGLRLSDIRRVNKDTIVNNAIVLKTQKTGTHVRIPLNNSAIKLLNFDLDGLKLFEKCIKQSYSRIANDLNEALSIIKIKKKITFHSSRHSFAINSLVLGIPIEVVSKILGHSDLKTTQIYAKVVDSLSNKEMEKWNNI